MYTENKEPETTQNTEPAIEVEPVLATVLRPQMASEALELIEKGKEIEMENQYIFAFMRCAENHKMRNLKFKCAINKYNMGWTAISKCCLTVPQLCAVAENIAQI
jgi:hypothetical protein